MYYQFAGGKGVGDLKKWGAVIVLFGLMTVFFVYRSMAEPELSVFTQSVFPYNEQSYISFSFEVKEDRFNELQLEQVDISTLDEFSYDVFPYEVVDYTRSETARALSLPANIEKGKAHTIIMGPIPEDALTTETAISLNFSHFHYDFNWEAFSPD